MNHKKIVLIDPETKNEPLYLEFKDEVFISYEDLIVCEVPLGMAYAFLDRQSGSYFEDHIVVDGQVKKYLLDLKEKKESR